MAFMRALNQAIEILEKRFKYERWETLSEAQNIANMLSEITGRDWQVGADVNDFYIWEND